MRRAALACLLATWIASSNAHADAAPTADATSAPRFAQPWYVRTLAGFGQLSDVQSSSDLVLTTEIGHRPFFGALATGASFSSSTDMNGAWTAVVVGAFAKVDLTYLFLSGVWSRRPPPSAWPRFQLGSRLGMAVSDSFGVKPLYTLVRAEMEPFLDVEIPLDDDHVYAIVARFALDTSVSFNALFRWSGAIGFSYGWGGHG